MVNWFLFPHEHVLRTIVLGVNDAQRTRILHTCAIGKSDMIRNRERIIEVITADPKFCR